MQVLADVVGEGERAVTLADDATYGDLLGELGFSPHEATAIVDGSPVPSDAPVDADRVEVLRLVKGGAGPSGTGDATPRGGADDATERGGETRSRVGRSGSVRAGHGPPALKPPGGEPGE